MHWHLPQVRLIVKTHHNLAVQTVDAQQNEQHLLVVKRVALYP